MSHEQELIAFAARNATAGRGTGIASSVVCNVDGKEVRRVLLFRGDAQSMKGGSSQRHYNHLSEPAPDKDGANRFTAERI